MALAADVFADVVQQRCEEQHVGARDLGRQARRQAVLGSELAAAQLTQAVDGCHRVHVHGVHVIHVVVHAPDDRGELRDHGDEQAHVV